MSGGASERASHDGRDARGGTRGHFRSGAGGAQQPGVSVAAGHPGWWAASADDGGGGISARRRGGDPGAGSEQPGGAAGGARGGGRVDGPRAAGGAGRGG